MAESPSQRPRLPLDEPILRPTFPARTAGTQQMAFGRWPVATRRAWPARRTGGRRRRRSRSRAHSARAQRLQEARRCSAREAVRERSAPPRRLRSRLARSSASTATTYCALRFGRWRAPSRRCRCRRNWCSSTAIRRSLAVATAQTVVSGDALVLSVAGGIDRRQGDARPADDAARRLRIRATASSATWATACRSISPRWHGSGRPSTTAGRSRRLRPSSRPLGGASDEVIVRVVASLARLHSSAAIPETEGVFGQDRK